MSNNTSNASKFLDGFCAARNIEKTSIRASVNRAKAKKLQEITAQYNGLSEEAFSGQFEDLILLLDEFGDKGATSVKFKYVTETEEIEEGENEEGKVKTETVSTTKTKKTPTDYIISVSFNNGTSYSKITSLSSPTAFRKMLSANLTMSSLRELGYKVNKTILQSNRKGKRLFDIVDVDWSK